MSQSRADRPLQAALSLAALICGGAVLLIVGFLALGARPALDKDTLARLFGDSRWQPGSARDPKFGVLPMLSGSLLVTALAILIATPLAVLAAIFQEFYAARTLARWHDRLLDLLAGVPSVVFGFWGLAVLVPAINRIQPPGQSLLAAALVLALMILPTIALTSAGAIRAVPLALLHGAAALGLGRARTVWSIVLPLAKEGIGAGVLLATTRAIGETMAVVMVCGNIAQIPVSLLDPVRPVTTTIALEMGYADATHKALLFAAALTLVLAIGLLVAWKAFRSRAVLPRYR